MKTSAAESNLHSKTESLLAFCCYSVDQRDLRDLRLPFGNPMK